MQYQHRNQRPAPHVVGNPAFADPSNRLPPGAVVASTIDLAARQAAQSNGGYEIPTIPTAAEMAGAAEPRPLYHVQGSVQTAPNVTNGGGGDGATASLAANRGVERYPNPLYQAGGAPASNNHYDMGVPLPGNYGGGGAEYATVDEIAAAAADADDDPRYSGYEAPDESAHGESPYDVAVHAGANRASNARDGNQSGVYNHLAPGKRAHDTGTRVRSADGHATVTDQTYAVVGEGDDFC